MPGRWGDVRPFTGAVQVRRRAYGARVPSPHPHPLARLGPSRPDGVDGAVRAAR